MEPGISLSAALPTMPSSRPRRLLPASSEGSGGGPGGPYEASTPTSPQTHISIPLHHTVALRISYSLTLILGVGGMLLLSLPVASSRAILPPPDLPCDPTDGEGDDIRWRCVCPEDVSAEYRGVGFGAAGGDGGEESSSGPSWAEEMRVATVTRMLGGVMVAASASWTMALWGSSSGEKGGGGGSRPNAAVRRVLASHSILGLMVLASSLAEDFSSKGRSVGGGGEGGSDDDADSAGNDSGAYRFAAPLCFGAAVTVASLVGMMASFWPEKRSTSTTVSSSSEREGSYREPSTDVEAAGFGSESGDLAEPLLPPSSVGDRRDHRGDCVPAIGPDEESGGARSARRCSGADREGEEDDPDPTGRSPGAWPGAGYDDDDGRDESSSAPQPSSRITGTRRLMSLAKSQTLYLWIGCAVLLMRLPFSLAIPHFVSSTLGALSRSDFSQARAEVLLLFVVGTVDAALDFWCVFLFGYANLRIVRGLRVDVFAAILRQEIAFFDRHTTGDLSSRLTSDCGEMSSDLTWFFRFSVESVVRISGIVTYMLVRSPTLGACAVSVVPVVGVLNKLYGDWLRDNAIKVQDALADANAVAQETLACVRTVVAFAGEEGQRHKYEGKIRTHYDLNVTQLYAQGFYYMAISTFLINTCVQAALLLVGTTLIQRGELRTEVLLAFMLYQGQLQVSEVTGKGTHSCTLSYNVSISSRERDPSYPLFPRFLCRPTALRTAVIYIFLGGSGVGPP